MRLALYQPDIPQNAGTVMRMAACLGLGVDLILPAGFETSDRAFRRAGLDYLDHLQIMRHRSWQAYQDARPNPSTGARSRLVLLTTKAGISHLDFDFRPDDNLLLGRESAGVPDLVHATADARVMVPMRPGMRSLNVAVAAAIVAGEALRRTGGFPALDAARVTG
jgi:tRNA (cytidine/uridine-2'-O-)-methyltransferase